MGHPVIFNDTPFNFEYLVTTDEKFNPLLVGIVKAAFRINPNGRLTPLKEQLPLKFGGEFFGKPEASAYKYEPECTPLKLNTDIVLIGTAIPPQVDLPFFDCGIQVANNSSILRVFGKRQWQQNEDQCFIQRLDVAKPIQLDYAYAFGGMDVSLKTDFGHPFEERNPVGIGFHHKDSEFKAGAELPLIECPKQLIENYHDIPEPAGVGFICGHWLQRRQYAGTYDEQWDLSRKPLLPTDFNRLFHNAASPALIANGYLQGSEPVSIINVGQRKLMFHLPGLHTPVIEVEINHNKKKLSTALDTVIINTDNMTLELFYRVSKRLNRGAHDIQSLRAVVPGLNKENIALVD